MGNREWMAFAEEVARGAGEILRRNYGRRQSIHFKGELLAGAVFNPLLSESFTASAGGGAFLNGERIAVSGIEDLRRSLLSTGFAYDVKEATENNLDFFRG